MKHELCRASCQLHCDCPFHAISRFVKQISTPSALGPPPSRFKSRVGVSRFSWRRGRGGGAGRRKAKWAAQQSQSLTQSQKQPKYSKTRRISVRILGRFFPSFLCPPLPRHSIPRWRRLASGVLPHPRYPFVMTPAMEASSHHNPPPGFLTGESQPLCERHHQQQQQQSLFRFGTN